MNDKTIRYQIHDNALTTDYVEKCEEGYCYKGHNGARYKLVYYTYANEWGDNEHTIYGRTLDAVLSKYGRLTHRLDDEQPDISGEADDDGHYETTRELAEMIEWEY